MTIISSEAIQLLFVTVHLNVVLEPTVTPVIVVVGLFVFVIVPGPLTIVQTPVPTEGVLAAIVKVLILQSV